MEFPKILRGLVPPRFAPGTAQDDLRAMPDGRGIWSTAGVVLASPGDYINALAPTKAGDPPFTAAPALTGLYLVWGLDPHDMLALSFACSKATDPDGETANARFWLLGGAIGNPQDTECRGKYGGELALTCGSQALVTGSVFADPTAGRISKWVDTIGKTADLTLRTSLAVSGSIGDNAVAEAAFDMEGHRGLMVHVVGSVNVSWLPFYRKL